MFIKIGDWGHYTFTAAVVLLQFAHNKIILSSVSLNAVLHFKITRNKIHG